MLIVTPSFARHTVVVYKAAGGADYSDIIFYDNCDSATNGHSPQKGTGTVTNTGGILLNTSDQAAGTGCWDQNNDGSDNMNFPVASNFDYTNSRIGFYWNPQEALTNAGFIIFTSPSLVSNGFKIQSDTGNERFTIEYAGNGTNNLGSAVSIGAWYFIELKFSDTTMELFIDGVSIDTRTRSNAFTDTAIHFGTYSGNALDSLWDQVIISNDNTRDLYAIRDVTDFS